MEKLTLDQIARSCGINRSKLSRGFRELYRCSVSEALAERRLAEARQQLLATDLPVSLIGYRSGYLNNASFHPGLRPPFRPVAEQFPRLRGSRLMNAPAATTKVAGPDRHRCGQPLYAQIQSPGWRYASRRGIFRRASGRQPRRDARGLPGACRVEADRRCQRPQAAGRRARRIGHRHVSSTMPFRPPRSAWSMFGKYGGPSR